MFFLYLIQITLLFQLDAPAELQGLLLSHLEILEASSFRKLLDRSSIIYIYFFILFSQTIINSL